MYAVIKSEGDPKDGHHVTLSRITWSNLPQNILKTGQNWFRSICSKFMCKNQAVFINLSWTTPEI